MKVLRLIASILLFLPFATSFAQNDKGQVKSDWEKVLIFEAGTISPQGTIKENMSVGKDK